MTEVVESLATQDLVHVTRDEEVVRTEVTTGIGPGLDSLNTSPGLTVLVAPDVSLGLGELRNDHGLNLVLVEERKPRRILDSLPNKRLRVLSHDCIEMCDFLGN